MHSYIAQASGMQDWMWPCNVMTCLPLFAVAVAVPSSLETTGRRFCYGSWWSKTRQQACGALRQTQRCCRWHTTPPGETIAGHSGWFLRSTGICNASISSVSDQAIASADAAVMQLNTAVSTTAMTVRAEPLSCPHKKHSCGARTEYSRMHSSDPVHRQ